MEIGGQNIWKQLNTTRLKYGRTGVRLDLGEKTEKNVFPLNMSFSVLKSLKQLAWRCLVETRAQNIQKRPNTTRLKYGRTRVSLDSNPSSTLPEGVEWKPELKIFTNGWIRLVWNLSVGMLRRLAAANPNNVKLEKFYSSIYRGPVLIQGDKKGDKFFIRVFIGDRCPTKGKKELSLARTTCLADKTNHPVERLSLNRSQCGSCSTKYDTSAGT